MLFQEFELLASQFDHVALVVDVLLATLIAVEFFPWHDLVRIYRLGGARSGRLLFGKPDGHAILTVWTSDYGEIRVLRLC